MAESSEKLEQKEGEKNICDNFVDKTSLVEDKKSSKLKDLLENEDLDDGENKLDKESIDEISTDPQSSNSSKLKLENFIENLTKRSKSKDQNIDRKDRLYKSESDSEDDSSKRQKLNECEPNTSSSESPPENKNQNKFNLSKLEFPKLESRFKNRSYRSQSNSSEALDDSSDHALNDNLPVSSSSDSDFPNNEHDSSDDDNIVSDDYLSNNWTTASEDSNDIDMIPAVLEKQPSKSDWCLTKDIINRQLGFNNSVPCRFYSSLQAVQRLELMYKLKEHTGCVNALSFNENGNLLASASDDLYVTIWDWATGKKNITIESGHRSNVFQSKWLPLDTNIFLISTARDGQVRLIDTHTSCSTKLAEFQASCNKISTHIEFPYLVLAAGEDSRVLAIDVREKKPTELLSVKEDDQEIELYSIDSNPLNSNEFCVAGRMQSVKIYDRRKPTAPTRELCPKDLLSDDLAYITCAVYNYNGTEIVASYNDEDIYLFDTSSSHDNGDFVHKYEGHLNRNTVKGVNFFGPNSEYILSGSDCGNIFIWDKKTEAIVQWMNGDEHGVVNTLEPHPHIPILATSGLDCDVKIWIPSREENPNIQHKLQSCVKKNLISRNATTNSYGAKTLWIFFNLINSRNRFLNQGRRTLGENNSDVDISNDDEDYIDDNSSSSSDDSSDNDNHSEN